MTTVENPSKKKVQKKRRPELTPEQVSFQKARGKHYRSLLRQVVEDMIKGVDKDKIGLFLSGGVDSTTVLWQLLELGVRPKVYTIGFPNKKELSTDAAKAKHLAETYKLQFEIVTMPSSTEKMARDMKDLSFEYTDLMSRADHEVVFMFQELFRAAAADGMDTVFSGICDENIHLVGRKNEVRARSGMMPPSECDYRRMSTFGGKQGLALAGVASGLGINFAVPLLIVAGMYPYIGVSWEITNSPRLKSITSGAWEVEEKTSGMTVYVAPMQCSDSGAREYFDDSIRSSVYVTELIGNPATSAIVLYNWLKKNRPDPEGTIDHDGSGLEWYSHVTGGTPLPEGMYPPVDENGDAKTPDKFGISLEEEVDEDDIFGDLLDDEEDEDIDPEFIRLEDGTFDKRIDCLGAPFWDPDAQFDCKRAAAGLCNKFQGDAHPYHIQDCTIFMTMAEWNATYIERVGDLFGSDIAKVYHKWSEISLENAKGLTEGTVKLP